MRPVNPKRLVKDYARIIFGTFMAACGIAIFSNPARLTGGGVTGVGTILYYTLGIDPGVSMLCINIPLFFLGMHFFGSKWTTRTPRTSLSRLSATVSWSEAESESS